MPRHKPFTDQMRQLILSSGQTRYRIAKEAGIDHAIMSRFINGKCGLSMESMNALAAYLDWKIVVDKRKS